MAEFLVRAWQPPNDIQDIGDIVVVKPDGWVWGKCECLPDYLVVRLPGVSVETVKRFEEVWKTPPVVENERIIIGTVLRKRRRFSVPSVWITSRAILGQTVVTLNTKKLRDDLIASVLDKLI